MAIVFRTPGPWGAGKGSNLAAAEVDENFWELLSRLAYLEDHGGPPAVSIDYFSVNGSSLTIHMTDHSIRGPFQPPVANWRFRKEGWQPATFYVPQDVFAFNGSAYLVLFAHLSAATFDPDANDGMGHDYYGLLLTDPGDALPLGGDIGQVLAKRSAADLDMEWTDPLAAGDGIGVSGKQVSQKWPTTTRTADYTLARSDAFSVIRMNVAVANSVTVPPNADVAFPIGTVIEIGQTDIGKTTIVAGAGVTINAPDGLAYDLRFRHGRLRKTGTDTWSFAFLGFGARATTAQYLADDAGLVLTTDQVWDALGEIELIDAVTIAVDMATFIDAVVTLGGNRTLGNPTNASKRQTGLIRIIQDATGGRTLVFGPHWVFANTSPPTLSTAPNAVDYLFYKVISASVVYATLVKNVG
jgi:hypothetical protein